MKTIQLLLAIAIPCMCCGQVSILKQSFFGTDSVTIVGIGNENPTSQLVVGDNMNLYPSSTGDTYLTVGDSGNLDRAAVIIGSGNGNYAKIVWQESVNELRFDLFKDGVPKTGVLNLNDNGNVGLSNQNLEPSELLSVGYDFGTSLSGNRITIGNNTGTSGLNIGEDLDNRSAILWDHTTNALKLGTRSLSVNYFGTLVIRNGKVGILNNDPDYDFHVGNGNINALNGSNTRAVVSDNDNGQRAAFLCLTKTSGGSRVEAQLEANGSGTSGPSVIMGSASSHPLFLRTGNLTRMTVLSNGNVGINTQSPDYNLEVNGSAAKNSGSAWTVPSDRRLKYDIKNFTAGLNEISHIQPISFRYNELSGFDTSESHVGVIAQDLQEIAPYMVNDFEKNGTNYLTVNNSAMTYMLINAVKDLARENTRIRQEMEADKSEINEIQTRLSELESLVAGMMNVETHKLK